MTDIEKGLAIFEKNNVKLSYKFRLTYGTAHATIFPNWKERENDRQALEDENSQTDIRAFVDYEILTKDRLQIWNYIREIINKTNLEAELKENDMFIGLHITICGNPSIPMQLSQSNLDYDEYMELK